MNHLHEWPFNCCLFQFWSPRDLTAKAPEGYDGKGRQAGVHGWPPNRPLFFCACAFASISWPLSKSNNKPSSLPRRTTSAAKTYLRVCWTNRKKQVHSDQQMLLNRFGIWNISGRLLERKKRKRVKKVSHMSKHWCIVFPAHQLRNSCPEDHKNLKSNHFKVFVKGYL